MKTASLRLLDVRFGNRWAEEVHYGWNYDDFLRNDDWRRGFISFDSLLWDPERDRVHAGITSFDHEVAKAFDRRTRTFLDTGFGAVVDRWDAKFHRSFVRRKKDGCFYAATALLHCVDHYLDAPGGGIFRHDPETGEWTKLCTPVPHAYIQNLVLDEERDLLYAMTYAPEYLLRYHLETGEVENLGLSGSGIAGMAQGENCVLDGDGTLWGTWSITRAWSHDVGANANRLFRVRPGAERIEFLQAGLPRTDGAFGFTKPEGFFHFGDGWVYASGANGSLFRIDPETGDARFLFTPVADRRSRLASLAPGSDGAAYGVTGRDGRCELLRFDYRRTRFEILGPVADETGEPCWQIHDVVLTGDGTLYAGENDVPHRSGYLWEIRPE